MSDPLTTLISRAEARAHELVRYFTGKACVHGHVSERWTSNSNCVACHDADRAGNAARARASYRAARERRQDFLERHAR